MFSSNPEKALSIEMEKGVMSMMYGTMFKYYLLNKSLSFIDIDDWNTSAHDDIRQAKNVQARWIPNDASLEISHAIRREGAFTCANCHSRSGILNWKELGYTDEEIESLVESPLE